MILQSLHPMLLVIIISCVYFSSSPQIRHPHFSYTKNVLLFVLLHRAFFLTLYPLVSLHYTPSPRHLLPQRRCSSPSRTKPPWRGWRRRCRGWVWASSTASHRLAAPPWCHPGSSSAHPTWRRSGRDARSPTSNTSCSSTQSLVRGKEMWMNVCFQCGCLMF